MIWNTIAHPKMMTSGDTVPPEPAPGPDDTIETTVIEGIKYADPHKLAFFDLLIDVTDDDNPKLIHGDFETVKNKILNHELVIGGEILYSHSAVGITIGSGVQYMKLLNTIYLTIFRNNGNSIVYVVSSDNAVSSNGGAPSNPGDQ